MAWATPPAVAMRLYMSHREQSSRSDSKRQRQVCTSIGVRRKSKMSNCAMVSNGIDAELTGALVVDPPGANATDEIFVIEMISERAGLNARETLATINGRSWPHTQRFQYEVGQPVRWRWVNASNEPHALHLHGFYYRIDAFNRGGRIQNYTGDSRPMVVTQRIAQGETFDMSWSPARPGRWLFHCHMLLHMTPPIVPEVPGLSVRPALANANEDAAMHEASGMGQLVLGITVHTTGKTASHPEWHADRKLQ